MEGTNLKEIEILEQMERLFDAIQSGAVDAIVIEKKLDKILKECNL